LTALPQEWAFVKMDCFNNHQLLDPIGNIRPTKAKRHSSEMPGDMKIPA